MLHLLVYAFLQDQTMNVLFLAALSEGKESMIMSGKLKLTLMYFKTLMNKENIILLFSQASRLSLQLLAAESYKFPEAPSFAVYREKIKQY